MSEGDSSYLDQSIKLDRIRQLRVGIPLHREVSDQVERHGGSYDFEVGVNEADEMPVIERIDRRTVKAISGGLQGVYRELCSFGEKVAADLVVYEANHPKPKSQ